MPVREGCAYEETISLALASGEGERDYSGKNVSSCSGNDCKPENWLATFGRNIFSLPCYQSGITVSVPQSGR